MRLRNLDLIVAAVIAALNIVWALLPGHVPVIGVILALPLVFLLPGYMLTELIFHGRSLEGSHRLIFSLGLTLAIDILSGLILNLLPVGLHGVSWALLLGLLTVVLSLLVAYLRPGAAENGAGPARVRLSIPGFLVLGLAAAIGVFSLLYAALGAAQQPRADFTQLWMLPAVQIGKDCAVRLGVRSFESTRVTYRVEMTLGGARVITWSPVVLAPQQEWVRLVPIPPGAASNVTVAAQLYRADKAQTVYRQVHLTLHSCPTTPYPVLASVYKGTIHDIAASTSTTMSLTGIQQNGKDFTGSLVVGAGLQDSGSFRGTVTTTRQLQFTVASAPGRATFSFEGTVDSGSTLSGSYCSLNRQGQCDQASGYGIWSAAPASP